MTLIANHGGIHVEVENRIRRACSKQGEEGREIQVDRKRVLKHRDDESGTGRRPTREVYVVQTTVAD